MSSSFKAPPESYFRDNVPKFYSSFSMSSPFVEPTSVPARDASGYYLLNFLPVKKILDRYPAVPK